MALTGGIGSGKSTVARMLVSCGAHLVDTDAIARSLTLPGGAALPAIGAVFGAQALSGDGALNRDHMRKLVFEDADAKTRLEAILHPLIGQEAKHQAGLAQPDQAVLFDVPLLAESRLPGGWRSRVSRVLVIDCELETQVARVAQRPGWNAEAARRVIAQQAGRAQRRAVADAVIFNEGLSLTALEAEVHALWQLWMVPSSAARP